MGCTLNTKKNRFKAPQKWGGVPHANSKHKKAEVVLISDKIDFKKRSTTRVKRGYFIMIKDQYVRKIQLF